MTYATHPFDVVGWDGCLYPYTFNVEDFMPITGKVHQPPPVHQVFEGHNFVVCNFLPAQGRLPPAVDPGALLPLQRRLRRGHVLRRRRLRGAQGLRHQHRLDLAAPGRPRARPAAVARSRRRSGRSTSTSSAVMVDTFRPLELGEAGLAVEDPAYAWTWAGRGPRPPATTRRCSATAGPRATGGTRGLLTSRDRMERMSRKPPSQGHRRDRARGRRRRRTRPPASPRSRSAMKRAVEQMGVRRTARDAAQAQPGRRLRLPGLRVARPGPGAPAHRRVLRERRQGGRRGGDPAPGRPRRSSPQHPVGELADADRLLARPAGPAHRADGAARRAARTTSRSPGTTRSR